MRAELFLAGADVVLGAVADPAVAAAWDEPSVLEEQTIGSLAAHVARGGGWIVGDYLDGDVPDGPADFESAAHYFHTLLRDATPEVHEGIRARGAAMAAAGPAEVVATLRSRLEPLRPRLLALDPAHLLAVFVGKTLSVHEYLATRIVEQVVHLDDLARSLDREPFGMPADSVQLAIDVATDVARREHGDSAVLRALYREGFAAAVLPAF